MARKKLIEVALPLEAQRLGLEAYASDLNPVAVLINKAMIEIPSKFAGLAPVNPEAKPHARHSGESRNPYLAQKLDPGFRRGDELFTREWRGAQGLAEDVRYYGRWTADVLRAMWWPRKAPKPLTMRDPEFQIAKPSDPPPLVCHSASVVSHKYLYSPFVVSLSNP